MAKTPTDVIAKIDDLLLDPAQRHVEPKAGQVGFTRAFRQAQSINEAERTIQFIASDATVDRYGEIVEPGAFRNSLEDFLKNPVFPFGHQYHADGGTLPTLGHWRSVEITDKALVGTAWFKPRGLGDEVFRDYSEGSLNSVSVGFITRAYEMRVMKVNGREQPVRVFTDVDLLEISAVLIPANPSARIRAAGLVQGHDGKAAPDAGFIKQFEAIVDRLEKVTAGLVGHQRAQSGVDAQRGRNGSLAEAYFSDAPDVDEPEPRQADQGNDELKSALRDALAVRGQA